MTNNKLRVLISDSTDPWFNLATEDWIFHELDPQQHVLFLWRNSETVVIGRSQNPWVECNLEKLQADQVNLVRRQSGGGAVYQDLGNSVFTFMSGLSRYDKQANNQIIVNALKRFGINARSSGRNDMVVESDEGEKKFSGSSFKQSKDRAFHHGTLLLETDLQRLQQYLNPNKKKLEAKGIKSVRSRVVNLIEMSAEINHQSVCQALIEAFFEYYQSSCEIEYLNHQTLEKIPAIKKYYEMLKSWDWTYGKTMEFTHQLEERFSWGHVDVRLHVVHGVIEDVVIYSDSLFPDFIQSFTEVMQQQHYDAEVLVNAFQSLLLQHPDLVEPIEDISRFVSQAVSS